MLPDPGERRRLLPWHFATLGRYGVLFGETYATSGDVRGVAVWLTPSEIEMTPERLAAAGMDQAPVVLGRKLGSASWASWNTWKACIALTCQTITGIWQQLESIRMLPAKEWEVHCCDLCWRLQILKENRAISKMAAADNKPFYEKHGFVVVRQGIEPVSGIDYWTFRREPR